MDTNTQQEKRPDVAADDILEEFSIVELEDRLEFVMKCDTNCGCPKPPAPQ